MTAPTDVTPYTARPFYTEQGYLQQLKKLLPTGAIWEFVIGSGALLQTIIQDTRTGSGHTALQDNVAGSGYDTIQDTVSQNFGETIAGSLWGRLLSCFAAELYRVEQAAVQLLNEAVPGLSTDLLEDWERALALPDSCTLPTDYDTIDKRRAAANKKYYGDYATVTEQYLVDLAAELGFTITIEELTLSANNFVMGLAIMGDNELGGQGAYAAIQITVAAGGTGTISQLQCYFQKIKPAHTVLVWVLP